jgi:hypothetical protein
MIDHPEVGRELKASELREDTIVWLMKEENPRIASLWVRRISDKMIEFLSIRNAGTLEIHLLAFREGENLRDEEAPLHVYEYLGADQPSQKVQ